MSFAIMLALMIAVALWADLILADGGEAGSKKSGGWITAIVAAIGSEVNRSAWHP
jgi:hypothetical protein